MSSEQKIIIISSVFILSVLLLVFFAIYPLFREIEKNSEKFFENKKKEILIEEKIKDLNSFKGICQKIEEDLKKVDQLFVDQKVPIGFIEFLEKTAENSNVLIDISPSPGTTRKGDLWPSLDFKITVSGSFPNCAKFLEKVETAPYLIEVQNLNLRRLTEKELESQKLKQFSTKNVTGILSIKTFAQ